MSEPKGLYNKYLVIKVVDDTVIDNCFILRPDKDPAAVKALQAYAAATENKVLADDLYKWVGKPLQKPMTHGELLNHLSRRHPHEIRPLYIEFKEEFNVDFASRWRDAFNLSSINAGNGHNYGKTWRCWEHEPTDEERAAAPWEK